VGVFVFVGGGNFSDLVLIEVSSSSDTSPVMDDLEKIEESNDVGIEYDAIF